MSNQTPEQSVTSGDEQCFVDADHAHDTVTRRSVTGIVLFVNQTPIKWLSRRQATVETSTYGSELCAARVAQKIGCHQDSCGIDGQTLPYPRLTINHE